MVMLAIFMSMQIGIAAAVAAAEMAFEKLARGASHRVGICEETAAMQLFDQSEKESE